MSVLTTVCARVLVGIKVCFLIRANIPRVYTFLEMLQGESFPFSYADVDDKQYLMF
jgi:hypothetical protein